jgi:N-acetyl-anhydromuramyl-L-alanine amidase AmpD
VPYPFIESPHFTPADGRAIGVVVIHTMEVAETSSAAEVCARWFQNPASEVSAHYCVDADSVVQCVREDDIAWHARGGNTNSIGIEQAGYAGQKALGWNDDYSRAVVERAARLTSEVCARYGIPVRRIRAADLVAGRRGITGHADVSAAFRKSDHWDPGPDFPWTRFLRLTRSGGAVERASQV